MIGIIQDAIDLILVYVKQRWNMPPVQLLHVSGVVEYKRDYVDKSYVTKRDAHHRAQYRTLFVLQLVDEDQGNIPFIAFEEYSVCKN